MKKFAKIFFHIKYFLYICICIYKKPKQYLFLRFLSNYFHRFILPNRFSDVLSVHFAIQLFPLPGSIVLYYFIIIRYFHLN